MAEPGIPRCPRSIRPSRIRVPVRHAGSGPSPFWSLAVLVQRRSGPSPFWSLAVLGHSCARNRRHPGPEAFRSVQRFWSSTVLGHSCAGNRRHPGPEAFRSVQRFWSSAVLGHSCVGNRRHPGPERTEPRAGAAADPRQRIRVQNIPLRWGVLHPFEESRSARRPGSHRLRSILLRSVRLVGPRLASVQWLRSASISSALFIFDRPSIPSSRARSINSSFVRSS